MSVILVGLRPVFSGDGQHLISFDAAVAAMKETAQHMSTRYKEVRGISRLDPALG